MPVLVFLAAMAAAPTASAPITVKGHQWAPFISPMGEPYRARNKDDDTLADWFYRADRNRDGVLTADEMEADAVRFFQTLDTDHDGEIDPDELANYEYEIAPDIQVMSRTERKPGDPAPIVRADVDDMDLDTPRPQADIKRERRKQQRDQSEALGLGGALQGGARYSLLNIPEPVAAADSDFNRAITLEEFRQAAAARFALLDSTHQGRLTLAQLEALPHAPSFDKHRAKPDKNALDARIGNPLPSGP
ncbi:MAG TPA: EF-hand domain-containing protein [Sphingomicrobium sp.]|jgi:Ca2+-binding EF-hand superfamily protein|nr:EF-hand domain-containing protein [Sphingomicrobium sp.]